MQTKRIKRKRTDQTQEQQAREVYRVEGIGETCEERADGPIEDTTKRYRPDTIERVLENILRQMDKEGEHDTTECKQVDEEHQQIRQQKHRQMGGNPATHVPEQKLSRPTGKGRRTEARTKNTPEQ